MAATGIRRTVLRWLGADYECFICEQQYRRPSDIEVGWDRKVEACYRKLMRRLVGFKFSPERGKNANVYWHEICPECSKWLCERMHERRISYRGE